MFFVVSTGRCGSTSIARVLSQSPNCRCLHEPQPLFVKEASLFQYGELGSEEIREILRKTRRPTVKGQIYGESNQKLSLLIPILAEEFPEAQFVWLVRDGRDVVASTMARGWYESLETTRIAKPGLTQKELDWSHYRLDGSKTGDFSSSDWVRMSRFEKCCWRWVKVNNLIERYLNQYKQGQFILIRLEDLEYEIDKIVLALGIARPRSGFQLRKHNVGQDPIKTWTTWSISEKNIFTTLCENMMNKLYPGWNIQYGNWQNYVPRKRTTLSPLEKLKMVNMQAEAYLRGIFARFDI